MTAVIFLILSLSWASQTESLNSLANRDIKIHRMDSVCENNPNPAISYDFEGFITEGKVLYLNFTITMNEDVAGPLSMTMRMQRCKSKENPDSCEHFTSFSTKQFCKFIGNQSKLWKPLFNSITPRWTCPLKKGVYRASNAPMETTALLLFPSEGWYWMIQPRVYNSKEQVIGCINIGVTVALQD